jgi:hypothetical protein
MLLVTDNPSKHHFIGTNEKKYIYTYLNENGRINEGERPIIADTDANVDSIAEQRKKIVTQRKISSSILYFNMNEMFFTFSRIRKHHGEA